MSLETKLLKLPSGARVKVRCLSVFDFSRASVNDRNDVVRLILTRCTGSVRFSDSVRKKIVDKPNIDDLDELTEISIEQLDQADAEMIVEEVSAISKIGKEAAEHIAKPFPETTEATVNSGGPAGDEIRSVTT